MYIEKVPNRNSRPAILLREGWREGRRTRKRTLANLTDWPAAQVEALRAVLKGDYQLLAPRPASPSSAPARMARSRRCSARHAAWESNACWRLSATRNATR
jgi:hypothetical protein